ncbi:radical SAM protein [bacterium]|nr:radical SAM protein [bacterium]
MRPMFDIDQCVREALAVADLPMSGHPAWPTIRAELTSPDVATPRKKQLLVLVGSWIGQALIGPQMVLIDITGRCNTTCVFCRDHSPRLESREKWRYMEMPSELIFKLIDQAEELGCEKMPILAAGEPSLHSCFPQIIERMGRSPMEFEVFSNGILLKDELIDLMASAERGRYYFSVSAVDNETFIEQRPGMKGDLLGQVEDNIRKLVERRKEKGAPRVLIVNVVNSGNFRQVIPMMEQAIRLGVDEVQYKLTEISEISQDMNLTREQLECVQLEMKHVKNLAAAAGVDVQDNLDVQMRWINPDTGNYVEGLYDEIPCRIGYQFARVRRDGMVSFCCGLKFVHNLNFMTLREHWWSREMKNARRVAFNFPNGDNMMVPDGGVLRDEQCDYCYNYILNVHHEREWQRLSGVTDPSV